MQTRREVLNTETVSAQWSVPVDDASSWTPSVSVTCTDCAESFSNDLCQQYAWAPTVDLESSYGYVWTQTIGAAGASMTFTTNLFMGLGAFTWVSNPNPQTRPSNPTQ